MAVSSWHGDSQLLVTMTNSTNANCDVNSLLPRDMESFELLVSPDMSRNLGLAFNIGECGAPLCTVKKVQEDGLFAGHVREGDELVAVNGKLVEPGPTMHQDVIVALRSRPLEVLFWRELPRVVSRKQAVQAGTKAPSSLGERASRGQVATNAKTTPSQVATHGLIIPSEQRADKEMEDAKQDTKQSSVAAAWLDGAGHDKQYASSERIAELEAEVRSLGRQLQDVEYAHRAPLGKSGTVRHFMKARKSFEPVGRGYLGAAEGDELVALHADGEWFYGFPFMGRQKEGWFHRDHVTLA